MIKGKPFSFSCPSLEPCRFRVFFPRFVPRPTPPQWLSCLISKWRLEFGHDFATGFSSESEVRQAVCLELPAATSDQLEVACIQWAHAHCEWERALSADVPSTPGVRSIMQTSAGREIAAQAPPSPLIPPVRGKRRHTGQLLASQPPLECPSRVQLRLERREDDPAAPVHKFFVEVMQAAGEKGSLWQGPSADEKKLAETLLIRRLSKSMVKDLKPKISIWKRWSRWAKLRRCDVHQPKPVQVAFFLLEQSTGGRTVASSLFHGLRWWMLHVGIDVPMDHASLQQFRWHEQGHEVKQQEAAEPEELLYMLAALTCYSGAVQEFPATLLRRNPRGERTTAMLI